MERTGKKRRILLAAHSVINRIFLREILGQTYEITEAASSTAALERLAERPAAFCLVLVEAQLPTAGGMAFLTEMHRRRWTAQVPVILVEEAGAPVSMARAYELGAVDCITRPFDASVVRHRVANAILLQQRRVDTAAGCARICGAAIRACHRKLYLDPLTGARSRRYYEEQWSGARSAVAAAMVDVDDFKQINDRYGHPAGDLALRQIGGAIRRCIRDSDQFIRYGGDEFVILFLRMPEVRFAERLEEIRRSVRALRLANDAAVRLSVSIGGTYGPAPATVLLRRADAMLYRAKTVKNQVCVDKI